MPRLADLQARIRSLGELNEVVSAMRALSAARVQQAQEALAGIRQYAAVIEDALADAVPRARAAVTPTESSAEDTAPGIVAAFGSEHGFVGAFNDRVLDRAVEHMRTPRDRLIVIGTRCAAVAQERGLSIDWNCATATQLGGVDDVALRVAEAIGRGGSAAPVTRMVLVYTRSSGGATWRIVADAPLPLDITHYATPRVDRPPPISNLAPARLLDRLVEEFVFSLLTHATTESFASENGARLAAMEAARSNIEEKLDDLTRLEREGRQDEITTELLDLVAGAEAMIHPSG